MNIQYENKLPTQSHKIQSYDIICFSHLRWDFVYQRPQHLLSRFANQGRVFYVEEPIFSDDETRLLISRRDDNLIVVIPQISNFDRRLFDLAYLQRELLTKLIETQGIRSYVLWFYTPMAMDFAGHLKPLATVFDCMDELSAFKFAPPELIENERKLLNKADIVFTGGHSLYEAKKNKHPKVFAFPSSIDVDHFSQARNIMDDPQDQRIIPFPRLGFCGVIDERMDLELLDKVAEIRPDWNFIMIGPVVKISEADLPKRNNIYYLGGKDYQDLPAYLSGWDVAIMPFAMNEATRYISPTKTPEYLAAGLPVVSTPIRDVVRPYHDLGFVYIADTPEEFSFNCELAMKEDSAEKSARVDEFLARNSWDKTWSRMRGLIDAALSNEKTAAVQKV